MVWEFVFLMVILKIPILYLCAVVWWAIRAQPRPPEGAALLARVVEPDPRAPFASPRIRSPRNGPHGVPVRRYGRSGRPAFARAHRGR